MTRHPHGPPTWRCLILPPSRMRNPIRLRQLIWAATPPDRQRDCRSSSGLAALLRRPGRSRRRERGHRLECVVANGHISKEGKHTENIWRFVELCPRVVLIISPDSYQSLTGKWHFVNARFSPPTGPIFRAPSPDNVVSKALKTLCAHWRTLGALDIVFVQNRRKQHYTMPQEHDNWTSTPPLPSLLL